MPSQVLQNYMAAARKPNLIRFSMFSTGADLSWIDSAPSGGGGGTGPIRNDLTSLCNGVTTVFTLADTPLDADHALIVHNGQVKRRGDANGYTLSGVTLTMAFPPSAGDTLVAHVWTA